MDLTNRRLGLPDTARQCFGMRNLFSTSVAVALGVLVPSFAPALCADTVKKLSDFEGVEEPCLRYLVATGKFVTDDYVNIRDVGDATVRMTLRYHAGEWWDSDRANQDTSRQRAEVKGIGPHQRTGETFEYGTTWRTSPDFKGTDRFCHVFQLKAIDGDNGAPLVVLSIMKEPGHAEVRYCSGKAQGFTKVRALAWKPGEWQTIRIRIKTSNTADGEILVSVNGDEFQGVKATGVFRPDATSYRPKWGLYRGIDKDHPMTMGEDWIEHRSASAQKLP
jgi:hypothetical protein